MKNKNILITGGAGFIGSNLCEHFIKQENQVTCFDNLLTGKMENIEHLLSNPLFTFIKGDIRDLEACKNAMKDVEIILHQAALGSVPRSINDPITTTEININGFVNILVAAKEIGVKRIVYAASSSTYGDSKALPKVEDVIGKPLSPYAITKYVNELYADVFSNLYGLELIGLRYFNVFGRRQDPNGAYAAAIPKFIQSLMKYESPLVHGDGLQTRDFTYIENVILANELAASTTNKEALNQVFNVAFGDQTTLIELIENLKLNLSKFDANIANVKILFGEERIGDIKYSLASIDKAKRLLNYHPQYSIAQGIEEAIEWYWTTSK